MIRQAAAADLDRIEEGYQEHFLYEQEHGAFTVFQPGVYPTRADAEQALSAGTLYVYEENGSVLGSIILDRRQPEEYQAIAWPSRASADQVMVIHLLMVCPSVSKRGIGSSLVSYALELAKQRSCKAVRLDTGAQNLPAAALYQKSGFQIIGTAAMQVGGRLPHKDHLFFEKEL